MHTPQIDAVAGDRGRVSGSEVTDQGEAGSRFGLAIVVVAVLALGFGIAVTSGLWSDLGGRVVARNIPDAMHYSWWLGHTPHALRHGRTPFLTYDLNWPKGVSAMNNTSLLLPAVLLSPITWMATSLASLNLLNVIAVPACAAAGYWALRQVSWDQGQRLRRPSALVGAVAFAISPAIVNSLVGHITMAFAPLMPILIVLSVSAWSRPRTRRTGLFLGLVAAAQLFTGEEVLFQSVLAAIIILLVAGLSRPRAIRAASRRLISALTMALAVFVPIAAYPLYQQFFGPLKEHGSPFSADYFGADLMAFTTPTSTALLHSGVQATAASHFPGGIEEHLAYLGWPLLITCLLTAVLGWRRLPIRCASVAMLTVMLLSLGGRLWVNGARTAYQGPYAVLARLPVVEGSLATRFALLAALFAATLLAFAVHTLSGSPTRWASGRRPALVGALLGSALSLACLVPLLPGRLPVVPAASVPVYFTTIARRLPKDSVVLVLPFPVAANPVAMRWQSAAGYRFRMPGGYFLGPGAGRHTHVDGGSWSATGSLLTRVATSGQPATATANRVKYFAGDLKSWGAHHVVLGPAPQEQALQETISNLLGFAPQSINGVKVWTIGP